MKSKTEIKLSLDQNKPLLKLLFDGIEQFFADRKLELSLNDFDYFYLFIQNKLKNAPILLEDLNQAHSLIVAIEEYILLCTEQEILLQIEVTSQSNPEQITRIQRQEHSDLVKDNQYDISIRVQRKTQVVEGIANDGTTLHFIPQLNTGVDLVGRPGSCGFISLGTTRDKVLADLLDAVKNKNQSIINRIALQINQDFLSRPGSTNLSASFLLKLKRAYAQLNSQVDSINSTQQSIDSSMDDQEVFELEQLKAELIEEKKQLDAVLEGLLHSPDLISDYLNRNIPDQWMSVGIALAWAQLNGISLCVWRERGQNQLYLLNELSYMNENSTQAIHIRQTNSETHFERIELIPEEELAAHYHYSLPDDKKPEPILNDPMELQDEINESPTCLSSTTIELFKRVKEKHPEAYSVFLGNHSFVLPKENEPIEQEELSLKYQLIYGDAPLIKTYNRQSHDHNEIESFQKQFKVLLVRLEEIISSIPWLTNERKAQVHQAFLLFGDNIFTEAYAGKQTNQFFEFVKKMLEDIAFFLSDEKVIGSRKMKIVAELLDALQVCGPGLYSKLDIIYRSLHQSHTLLNWLSEYREALILMYTETFPQLKNKNKIQTVHVINGFKSYAWNTGWNPAGNDSILTDNFLKSAEITEDDILEFHRWFLAQYTPQGIINNLITVLTPLLKEIDSGTDFDIYRQALQNILDQVGVEATKCLSLKPDSFDAYEIDFVKLRVELISGLVSKGIIDQKVMETFVLIQLTETDTLHYSPVFSALSYVNTPDGYTSLDQYLSQMELMKNLTLAPDLMKSAIQGLATPLVLYLLTHQGLSGTERAQGEIYLNKAFENSQIFVDFLTSLPADEQKRLIGSDFFSSDSMKQILSNWIALKAVFELSQRLGEASLLQILNVILTETHLQTICSSAQDKDPVKSLTAIDGYLNSTKLKMIFNNKTLNPTILDSVQTGAMLLAIFRNEDDLLLDYLNEQSPERLKQLFGTPASLSYLSSRVTDKDTFLSILKLIDTTMPSIWTDEMIKTVSIGHKITLGEVPVNLRKKILELREERLKQSNPGVVQQIQQGAPQNPPQAIPVQPPQVIQRPNRVPGPPQPIQRPNQIPGMPEFVLPENIRGRLPVVLNPEQLMHHQQQRNQWEQEQARIAEEQREKELEAIRVKEEFKAQIKEHLASVKDKKSFIKALCSVTQEQLPEFLSGLMEVFLNDQSQELAFLKPKSKQTKSITAYQIQQMILNKKDFVKLFDSKEDYHEVIFQLTVLCPGNLWDNLNQLDNDLLDSILSKFDRILTIIKAISKHERKAFFLEMLYDDSLWCALENEKNPGEKVQQLLLHCKLEDRLEIILEIIRGLQGERKLLFFPDLASFEPILTVWNKNASCKYIEFRNYRGSIVEELINTRFLDLDDLLTSLVKLQNSWTVLEPHRFASILVQIGDEIKKDNEEAKKQEEERKKEKPSNLVVNSVFKPAPEKRKEHPEEEKQEKKSSKKDEDDKKPGKKGPK